MKVIDQTWVSSWGSYVTADEELKIAKWVASHGKGLRSLALRFPPYSLVRLVRSMQHLTEKDYEMIPAPGTLGVVVGLGMQGGFVLVKQSPYDPPGEAVEVNPDLLEMVKPWAGLTRDYLRAVIAMTDAFCWSHPFGRKYETSRGKAL